MSAGIIALVTFFVTAVTQRKHHKEITEDAFKQHIEVHHGQTVTEEVTRMLAPIQKDLEEKLVQERDKREKLEEDFKVIKNALMWLVVKQGGKAEDAKDMGLM